MSRNETFTCWPPISAGRTRKAAREGEGMWPVLMTNLQAMAKQWLEARKGHWGLGTGTGIRNQSRMAEWLICICVWRLVQPRVAWSRWSLVSLLNGQLEPCLSKDNIDSACTHTVCAAQRTCLCQCVRVCVCEPYNNGHYECASLCRSSWAKVNAVGVDNKQSVAANAASGAICSAFSSALNMTQAACLPPQPILLHLVLAGCLCPSNCLQCVPPQAGRIVSVSGNDILIET